MLINVFNKETKAKERLDSSVIDASIHVHANTLARFSEEDLEAFGANVRKSEPKVSEPKVEKPSKKSEPKVSGKE